MIKKYIKKISAVCIVAFAVGMVFLSLAFAPQSVTSWSTQEREVVLATPEYTVLKVTQGNSVPSQDEINAIKQHDKDMEKYYLSLSDAQFESVMKTNLSIVINRVNSGDKIVWNKSFVEGIVKSRFPELYPIISAQESKQVSITGNN